MVRADDIQTMVKRGEVFIALIEHRIVGAEVRGKRFIIEESPAVRWEPIGFPFLLLFYYDNEHVGQFIFDSCRHELRCPDGLSYEAAIFCPGDIDVIAGLRYDRQGMAFEYHALVGGIPRWVHMPIERLTDRRTITETEMRPASYVYQEFAKIGVPLADYLSGAFNPREQVHCAVARALEVL